MEALVDGILKLPAKLHELLISHGHKLPKGADAEIPLIKQDLEKMITFLQDEDNARSEESPMMVNCWIKEVRELSYDIDDCIDQYEHAEADRRSRPGYRIPRRKIFRRTSGSKTNRARLPENLKRRLWMANKIREFSRRSQAALERHSSFDLRNFICSSTRFDAFGSWHPTKYEERAGTPVGVDASMNMLEEWLTKDKDGEQNLKVVSVCGSGGVGKTTLCNELYRKIGGQFQCRAFVRTSKRPDIRRLLISVLSQVAPHHLPDNWEAHSLIANIRTLLQDKRYLIVIDDVWATSTWEIVKCALPDGNGCSRILVTTEIEDVALRCCGYDSSYVFMMKPLVEKDSRKLFFGTAFGPQHACPLELSEVSNSIIRKCGGLPLAIVTIASLLASRMGKVEQWDYVDKSLGHALRENPSIQGMKELFNLCFDNLPQHLKACIMCLSIYQESYIIWKDDLVKQWTSEGFVCATEEKGEEEISRSYFDELISSRLIQPVHINGNYEVLSCTVHGMVHNFITHKSMEENFVTAVDQSQTTTRLADKVRRLSLQFGNAEGAPPTNMRLSQVRTLAFFGVFKCVPSILEFQLLQVLILDILGNEESISLDITRITELYRLRYLQVTCNVILELRTQMWGLNFLPRLLHLNVPARTKLPDGIGHMTSLHTLRYFDLNCNSAENVVSLGKLTNLQDLQFAGCTKQADNLKSNMERLGTVLGKLSKIKSLTLESARSSHVGGGLSMHISSDGLRRMSSPPTFLQRLDLSPHICTFSSLPDWIGHLSWMRILKIAVIELVNSDVDVLRGLPALTFLSLYVCTKLAERIVLDKGGFSVLKYLKFRCSVPWLKFEAGALPNLQKLKLGFNAPLVEGRDGAASIIIDHLPGLQEITAKIGGAISDAETSALTATISNDRTNPTINVQLVDYTFYCDEIAKDKEQQVEILEEETNEHEPKQAVKRLGRSPSFSGVIREAVETKQVQNVFTVQKELAGVVHSPLPRKPLIELARWKLAFEAPPQLPIFTNRKIEDVNGNPLLIILVGLDTSSLSALPRFLRIKLVPLSGDFSPDDREEWSADEFSRHVVKVRPGNCPLLTGNVNLIMQDGFVTVKDLKFTDNSSWLRCGKFRIGVHVVGGSYNGPRISEGMTEAFNVRDHPGELYRKHYPPALGDDVWRLEKIQKNGVFHSKLASNNIKNVQEFLMMLNVKPDLLRTILGDGMNDRMWGVTTKHARTCILSDKLYVHSGPQGTIYVDSIFQLKKIDIGGVEYTVHQLSSTEKLTVQQLLLEAYEQRNYLKEIPVLLQNVNPFTYGIEIEESASSSHATPWFKNDPSSPE